MSGPSATGHAHLPAPPLLLLQVILSHEFKSDFLHGGTLSFKMDPFEVRMQFLTLLRRLNASVIMPILLCSY